MTTSCRQRSGGRAARLALRSAPLAEDLRAIRPGLESGRYKPLTRLDIEKIHNAALDVVERIGLGDATPSVIEAVITAGGVYKENGRLCFPRTLVEDMLAKARRDLVLYAQDPKWDLDLSGSHTYFSTAGAAVTMIDARSGDYRESTAQDLYNIARLVDTLDNIHMFQRTVVCRDIQNSYDLDVNTCYLAVSGTRKHVGSSWSNPASLQASLKMLHMIAGSEAQWRARPFVSMSSCFVVPPLKFATGALDCLEVAIRNNMPVLLLAAGQAGATSPASLAGAVVQQTAEVIAGFCIANAITPGAPVIFGTWPFVSDLRTGAMSGGSPEQALLVAACSQMGRFYDLPTGICSGMSDSKIPDYQAGAEKGYSHALTANSGANLIYEAAGMHSSLLGCCYESFVMDNDTIGDALRTVRGIEVTDEAIGIESMRAVVEEGPGHYLGHEQTLKLMQTEYYYPATADRSSPKEWDEKGRPTALSLAERIVNKTLAEYFPRHVSDSVDATIREQFGVILPRSAMSASNPLNGQK